MRGWRSSAPAGWSRPRAEGGTARDRAFVGFRCFVYAGLVSAPTATDWILRCDGGARGNPGPAAYGFVLTDPTGREAEARGEYIGHATNNVAEYRSLIAGLEAATQAGADPLLVCMDSELVVRQMTGEYRVKNAGLKPLHAQARLKLATLGRVRFSSVRREANTRADGLVNEALDAFLGFESPR
jgi:ribonuclease HI